MTLRQTNPYETYRLIEITPDIHIDEKDIRESFIRSSGPGGQHVNKVATAVQLHFNSNRCSALDNAVKNRLQRLAGKRMKADGTIIIQAARFKSREQNRKDALDRLIRLIREAAVAPVHRKPSKPSKASRLKRLARKNRRARIKQLRRRPSQDDE